MKKIYTCHFDSIKVGKKVLKNLNFASINKKEWIGIDSNNLRISDYNKFKSMVTPVKHSDGRITGNMFVSIITIIDLAHKSKKQLVIKEVA